jgi:UDP-glucose 4-epimerase
VYNVAGNACHSVLDLLTTIGRLLEVEPDPVHTEQRAGDVRDSHADLTAAGADLGYVPTVSLEDGLRRLLARPT